MTLIWEGIKKWLAVNNFLKFKGVLNRAFTALSAQVKYIHYIWAKTFLRGKVTKFWLGAKNFSQQKLLLDEIFPDKVHLTFMKFLNKSPTPFPSQTKKTPYPLPPINIGIRPRNSWLIISTSLPHLCKISRPYLVQVPNYWTWTKSIPQKIGFSGEILIKLRLW